MVWKNKTRRGKRTSGNTYEKVTFVNGRSMKLGSKVSIDTSRHTGGLSTFKPGT